MRLRDRRQRRCIVSCVVCRADVSHDTTRHEQPKRGGVQEMVCDGGRLRATLAAAAATPPATPPAVAVWTMEGGAPRGGTAGWGRRGTAAPPAAAAGLGKIWLPGGDAPAHIRMRLSGACRVVCMQCARVVRVVEKCGVEENTNWRQNRRAWLECRWRCRGEGALRARR